MKYFFILGRNPDLSRAEVIEYLKARGRTHNEVFFDGQILVVETNEGEKFDIQEFGGVMFLGEVEFEGDENGFMKYVENEEIIPADKFSYGVFGNLDTEIMRNTFKSRKKKASLKHSGKQIKFQDGEKSEIPNADFYLLYTENNGVDYFGRVNQIYDKTGSERRDMGKPIRREALAISPRLSKILVNLSGAKPYDLMLDPFCGVGGILQEALIKKINVYGIDKDKKATEDCRQNIEWVKENFGFENKYTIENLDSRKTPDMQFNAIATEAPLGVVLRKKVDKKHAEKIIKDFESLIIPILARLKKVKKPEGKIAITFPVVSNNHCDIQKIASATGLEIYIDATLESRSDQFICRDIAVFK